MQILVLIVLYFLKCTKFDQLILRKIAKNCCHQMPDFKAKMHQIRFQLAKLQTFLGELTALPRFLAGFKRAYFGREGDGRARKGRAGKGRAGEGRSARLVCLFVLTIMGLRAWWQTLMA